MNRAATTDRETLRAIPRIFAERGDVAAVFRLPDALRHPAFPGPRTFDLGVLFHPLVDGSRYEELRIEISEAVAVEVARADIRLVVLNDASPNLAYDLIRRGYPVYVGSEEQVRGFEIRVQTEFLRSVHDRTPRPVIG
ncbi:MAG: hypothetical protein ABIK65_14990 [Candidatus Eisenbacteria bacterium]